MVGRWFLSLQDLTAVRQSGVRASNPFCVPISSAVWGVAVWIEENLVCRLFSGEAEDLAQSQKLLLLLTSLPHMFAVQLHLLRQWPSLVSLWQIFILALQDIPRNNAGFFLHFRQHYKQSVTSAFCHLLVCCNIYTWCISQKLDSKNSVDLVCFPWKYPPVH